MENSINGYIDINYSKNSGVKKDSYNIDLKDGNWTKEYAESKVYNFLKNDNNSHFYIDKHIHNP